jgi:hypothetical protein
MFDVYNGIKIKMSKNDLNIPHVEATYGNYKGIFSIKTGKIISGNLPSQQVMDIEYWVVINEEKLMSRWNVLS